MILQKDETSIPADKATPVDFVFLDSGTGGIPYMEFLKKACPECHCEYYADSENFPYGTKTTPEIIECVSEAVTKIIKKYNPSVIVIACNTISVTALDALRKKFSVPFVGTVPAIKLAAKISKNKRIGLLATQQTVTHPYTDKLIKDFASDCNVFKRGDTDLVEFIEHRLKTATQTERQNAIKGAIDYFKENEVDTIILGCTHFIFMADDIAAMAGNGVQVIDSREGVVRQALKLWK